MNSDIEKKVQDAINYDEIIENIVCDEINIAIDEMMYQHAYGEREYFKVCNETDVFGWILQDYLHYKTNRTRLYSFYDSVNTVMNEYVLENRDELINAFTTQLNEYIEMREECRNERPEEYDDTETNRVKERLLEIIEMLQSVGEEDKSTRKTKNIIVLTKNDTMETFYKKLAAIVG